MGDAHVGGGPCAEAGYYGTETVNVQVGGGPRATAAAPASAPAMVVVGTSYWDDVGAGAETGERGADR